MLFFRVSSSFSTLIYLRVCFLVNVTSDFSLLALLRMFFGGCACGNSVSCSLAQFLRLGYVLEMLKYLEASLSLLVVSQIS